MRRIGVALSVVVVVAIAALALTIALGGPKAPPPLASISDPFKAVDFSDLPQLETFPCRGGDPLAFREYRPAGPAAGTVVLVHGSSGHSASMHVMGKAFAKAGYRALALDMRGHGASGERGQAKFVGHLEYDVEDFLKAAKVGDDATLVGFSAGGGFVLRFAAGEKRDHFAGYVLVAPFVSHEAPTYREGGGGWVGVGVPRIVALAVLNGMGVTAFNRLPVMRFAVRDEDRKNLTAEYSYTLASNFRPPLDWQGTIRAVRHPMAVVVGEKDELFYAERFAPLFAAAGSSAPVTVVPGVNHIGMIVDEKAIQAVIAAVRRQRAGGSRG
jgi:alpha-beta hydrolase superfamily lysophospholipase